MLFNIAVDVYQRMMQVANDLLERSITNRVNKAIIALQYADDTTVIARADEDVLIISKLILRLFTNISRLPVNYGKCSFVPINVKISR